MNDILELQIFLKDMMKHGIKSSGVIIDTETVKRSLTKYLEDRKCKVISSSDATLVTRDGEYVARLFWDEFGFSIDTDNENHHLVLEIILMGSHSVMQEIKRVRSQEDDNSDDEYWI